MHTHPFNGSLSRTTRVGRYQNIHPLTPILITRHPLSTSSIYYDPQHLPCSTYVLDGPFWQPLSRSSLVYSRHINMLFFTQSSLSSRNACPYHHSLFCWSTEIISSIPNLSLIQHYRTQHKHNCHSAQKQAQTFINAMRVSGCITMQSIRRHLMLPIFFRTDFRLSLIFLSISVFSFLVFLFPTFSVLGSVR